MNEEKNRDDDVGESLKSLLYGMGLIDGLGNVTVDSFKISINGMQITYEK